MKNCLKFLTSFLLLFLIFSFFAKPSFAGNCGWHLVSGTQYTYVLVPPAPYSHSAGWGCTFPGTVYAIDRGNTATNSAILQIPNEVTLTVSPGQTVGFGNISIPVSTASGYTKGKIILSNTGIMQKGQAYYTDADSDTYIPSGADSNYTVALTQPAGTLRSTLWQGFYDCDDANANIYSNQTSIVIDADNDGYPTSTTGATTCVGATSTINGRTYYKNASGNYDDMKTASILAAAGGGGIAGGFGGISTTGQTQLPAGREMTTAVTATIGGTTYIYLIGGCGGCWSGNASTVYKVSLSATGDVSTITTTGQGQLPKKLAAGAAAIWTNQTGTTYVYYVGGVQTTSIGISSIYKASISSAGDISAWADVTNHPTFGGTAVAYTHAMAENYTNTGYLYISGGSIGTSTYGSIYRAALGSTGLPGAFSNTALPGGAKDNVAADYVTVGGTNYFYVFGGVNASNTDQVAVYQAAVGAAGAPGTFTTEASLPFGGSRVWQNRIVGVNPNGTNYEYFMRGDCYGGSPACGEYRAVLDALGDFTSWTGGQGDIGANFNSWGPNLIAKVGATYYIYLFGGQGGQQSMVYQGTITNPSQVDCNDSNAAIYPGDAANDCP